MLVPTAVGSSSVPPELSYWPYLWHLGGNHRGQRLSEPGLGCTDRLEPVRVLPICVFQRAGVLGLSGSHTFWLRLQRGLGAMG